MWYRNKAVYRALQRALLSPCFAALFVFGILSLVLPKATVSETEKRSLAPFPPFSWQALFAGTWTREFELHYADTFPFRDAFVQAAAWAGELRGLRYDAIRVVLPEGGGSGGEEPPPNQGEATATATTTATTATSTTTASSAATGTGAPATSATTAATAPVTTTTATAEPLYEIERSGPVIIYGDRAFELFGGSTQQKLSYAAAVSAYAKALPDVKVYSLVAPSAIAFYLPAKYASYSTPQKENIDDIYGAMDPAVTCVDAYSRLAEHSQDYEYFRTDHHWTGLGAYWAYTAFAEAAGFTPLPYEDYEKGSIENFNGTFTSSTNDAKLRANPDTVEYCKLPVETLAYRYTKDAQTTPVQTTVLAEYASGGNAYSVYLHGDFPRFDIQNLDNPEGKNILVLKESYGNAFAPYLVPHYANVYVVDMRYFAGSIRDFAAEKAIDEILVIDNVFAANTKSFTSRLELLLSR